MTEGTPVALDPPQTERPAAIRSARAESRAAAWLDRLNPILIKEVRQGLRARTFWIFFGLMLLACTVIALISFGVAQEAGVEPTGAACFVAVFVALGLAWFFVLPYNAYRSQVREREDETWVLLNLTGLGPRRILRGKMASSMVQAVLYGSAAAPFVLFSYFLNGVDLPTILFTLGLAAAYMLFLTAVSVSAATLGESRVVRSVVHLSLLGALLVATGFGFSSAGALSLNGRSAMTDPDVQAAMGIALWLMASYGVLLFEAAAARLSLPTEDYARGPRLTAAVQVVITVLIAAWLWDKNGRSEFAPIALSVGLSIHLGLVGMFLSSDVDGQAARHRPRTGPWSFLRPGALRGYRLTVLLLGVGTAAALVLRASCSTPPRLSQVIAAPAYALFYLSVPILIARGTGSRALSTPVGTRVLTLVLTLMGCGLPPLVALLAGSKPDNEAINLLNPMLGLIRLLDAPHSDAAEMLAVVWPLALLAALGADRSLAARDRAA